MAKQAAKNKRDERLQAALRANLNKRKQQNRSRAGDPSDAKAAPQKDAGEPDVPDEDER